MTITTKAFNWASNPKNTWMGIAVRAVVVMLALPVLLALDIIQHALAHRSTDYERGYVPGRVDPYYNNALDPYDARLP